VAGRAAQGRAGREPRNREVEGALASGGLEGLLDLFANTADGVAGVDPGCRIAFWNRAAEQILGYGATEVLGRPCYEVFRGLDDRGNILCHPHCHVLVMARQGQPVHAFEAVVRAKDGAERRLNISVVLVPAPQGTIAVHMFRDVTDARRPEHVMEAIIRALHGLEPWLEPARSNGLVALTSREHEILGLLASGEDTQRIARRLGISTATVRNHAQNILRKLGVHSRLEAVALAFRSGGGDPSRRRLGWR